MTYNSSSSKVECLDGLPNSKKGSVYKVSFKTATGSIPCSSKNGCYAYTSSTNFFSIFTSNSSSSRSNKSYISSGCSGSDGATAYNL